MIRLYGSFSENSHIEQSTAHSLEFTDFFMKNVLCDLKMIRKAVKAEILRRTAVDQLPGERFFIPADAHAAADAQVRVNHGKEPGNTDTVSYHVPEPPD